MTEWPAWLEELVKQLRVQVVLLFGDCRPIHVAARRVAERNGLEIGVFEEGYLRPHYITFERHGVNAHSRMPRSRDLYESHPEIPRPRRRELGNTYWYMVMWATLYFAAGSLGKPWFPHYEHHRRMSLLEGLPWVRSVWRKLRYRVKERNVLQLLCTRWDKRFFLVPLQVYNDSQISTHSDYLSIEEFIEEVVVSFAHHAPPDTALVIKHHPMSRGYTDYTDLLSRLACEHRVTQRCFYIHDQHLPTLLKHASGAIIINSTVGLQALQHRVPVKVLGEAIFNFPGLCYQGLLKTFWNEAGENAPDRNLLQRFVSFLIARSQLNASFYKRLPGESCRAGVPWLTADWAAATDQARRLERAQLLENTGARTAIKAVSSLISTPPTSG